MLGALLNSNQIATDIGKDIRGTLGTMEKETDENSHGIAVLSNDVTTGNDVNNGTCNGVGVLRYVLCSLL